MEKKGLKGIHHRQRSVYVCGWVEKLKLKNGRNQFNRKRTTEEKKHGI